MFARCVTGALPVISVGFRRVSVNGAGAPLGGSRNQASCTFGFRALPLLQSPPARGAWIETSTSLVLRVPHMSPPARGAWIETYPAPGADRPGESPPARGAWIETR